MKKALRILVIVIILAALIVFYYWFLSNRTNARTESAKEEEKVTELNDILLMDLSADYPKTPRAVMKLYNRIITLYYNEELSDTELRQLFGQQRNLYDTELLLANPEDTAFESLKLEVAGYEGTRLLRNEISDSEDIQYTDITEGSDIWECAYVDSSYFMMKDSTYTQTYMQYCMRKDSEGKWKIVAYYTIDKADDEDD